MKIWTLVFVCAVLALPVSAADFPLPITVQEPSGIARTAEPVSGGIPLPWGRFKPDTGFVLSDANGRVPLQASPLVVDEKGYLRWILLDFQTDLKPNEKKAFTLTPVEVAKKMTRRLAAEDRNSVTISTGEVVLAIAKTKPFSLFTSVKTGGKAVAGGGTISYTDDFDGKTYAAGVPASVVVEYNGPVRTTVAVKGRFVGDDHNKLRYIARITAWKGSSKVHVKYSLSNSNPDHYAFRRIKDSNVTLRLAGAPKATVLGASKPLAVDGDAWIHQSSRVVSSAIHSHDRLKACGFLRSTPGAKEPGGCKAMAGDKDVWTSQGKGDVAEGWIKAGGVWVSDLYFVEDPPRRLAVKDGSLVLTGVTAPLEGAKWPFATKQRWLFDCSHLSSQYMFDFAAPADTAQLSQNAKLARARVHALAPPAWYFSTKGLAVGKFGTQADELKSYDTWGWEYDKAKAPKSAVGQTGRIKRWTAADDNHFVSEQDTLDGLILMYLRTGSRSFFNSAESWANYFVDLQTWRTDGWRWKDGGGWWHGGPAGNRPQRAADPVTGVRNRLPSEWTKSFKAKPQNWDRATCLNISYLFLAKACHCHNWGEGLAEWYCLTGDRDAYEAAIDTVEQNYDTHRRAFRRVPGTAKGYSRDFTRTCYLTNATRLIAPTDPYIIEASDYLTRCFLERPNKEPRGLVNGPGRVRGGLTQKALMAYVGQPGIDAAKAAGITINAKTGELTDPKTGAKWFPITGVGTWMYPPLSRAMDTYYAITGNEDAHDWLIAYGQAAARVMWQPKHGNLDGKFLADFPKKGVVKDHGSWLLPEGVTDGKGVQLSGYLAGFYPDVPARAYSLCGEALLKQRAHDYWFYGSHRSYRATKMSNVGKVGRWVNLYSTHNESVCFTGRTFYEWAHPRRDGIAPKAVTDLVVSLDGNGAKLRFTAPSDEGGKTVRYQVKCSDKPIVDYGVFLEKYAANEDATVTNWWMAANLKGELAPKRAGAKEAFAVTGVPKGAKYFAVRSFDDSSNRSALSNVAEAK
jgi:exo-rhamnogalacturonan lyase-like protein